MDHHSTNITWLTTPPLKHFSTSLKKDFTDSSPTIDSSPIVVKRIKTTKTSTDRAQLDFDDFLESEKGKDCLRLLVIDVPSQDCINVLDPVKFNVFQLTITGDWMQCTFKAGKFIHIVHPRGDLLEDCILGNDDLVVIDPDELIAALNVADSFQCMRRSVLKQKIKPVFLSTVPMVYGNIMHDLFQIAIKTQNYEPSFLEEQLRDIINNTSEDLYYVGSDEKRSLQDLAKTVKAVIDWKSNTFLNAREKGKLHCTKVVNAVEVEERVMSPLFGLKGFVDVTIQAMHPDVGMVTMPLELKTGVGRSQSHHAQTSLYTLLLSDKRKAKVDTGLLVYLNTNETLEVSPNFNDKRGMIVARNNLAHFSTSDEMPPIIDNPSICSRCYSKSECFKYHKSIENGTPTSSGSPKLFEEYAGFLTKSHVWFLRKWEAAIKIEESKTQRQSRDIWAVNSKVRENLGTCVSGLRICFKHIVKSETRFQHHYHLTNEILSSQDSSPVSGSLFLEGDPIMVTRNDSRHPVAIGFLIRISGSIFEISTDRPIDKNLSSTQFNPEQTPTKTFSYTIDKDGYSTGQGLIRANIFQLFAETSCRRRDLIVDLALPVFSRPSKDLMSVLGKYEHQLNDGQINSILKIGTCEDYALILGMPGTGKTHLIAKTIKILIEIGKTILLTSYTHSAVDNVLIKLLEMEVDFVRLGTLDKMHSNIRDYTQKRRKNLRTVSEFQDYYGNAKIVATTALGITHPLFAKKAFDYCIVDESSQIALPVCLGPLQFASKFVLVGDQYQLSPLFSQDDEKSETVSLFKLLCQAHPKAVSSLRTQYRMNQDIMSLCNHLVYDGRLKCGSINVANSILELPSQISWARNLHSATDGCIGNCWLGYILNPRNSVVFCDTDLVPAIEVKTGPFIDNPVEAEIILQILKSIIDSGGDESEISIICPYRNQLKRIAKATSQYPRVELLTVDKSQGRDKKCVILSLTRSNDLLQAGDLMKDWQRMNVSITRAKVKLIFVGSVKTLGNSKSFANMFEFLNARGWIYKLPLDAHNMHQFHDSSSMPPSNHKLQTPKYSSHKRKPMVISSELF